MSETPYQLGPFVIRSFDVAKDTRSVQRIWHECGWKTDADESYIEEFYSAGMGVVAALDDLAECAALVTPGTIRYQECDLPLAAVTAVVTSPVARKRRLGATVTAQAIARAAAGGAEIAALGIFEQGYYDLLGFGSGGYEHVIAFDPADLKETDFRIPRRLSKDDWMAMHGAMKSRWMSHGGCVLTPPKVIKAEAGWTKNGFGMGYFDDFGELTHFFFGKLDDAYGPFGISAMAKANSSPAAADASIATCP